MAIGTSSDLFCEAEGLGRGDRRGRIGRLVGVRLEQLAGAGERRRVAGGLELAAGRPGLAGSVDEAAKPNSAISGERDEYEHVAVLFPSSFVCISPHGLLLPGVGYSPLIVIEGAWRVGLIALAFVSRWATASPDFASRPGGRGRRWAAG